MGRCGCVIALRFLIKLCLFFNVFQWWLFDCVVLIVFHAVRACALGCAFFHGCAF